MSTAPQPADPYAAAIQRLTTVVIGAVVAAIFAVVVVGFLVWHASRPAPSPSSPIPADTRAHLIGEVAALRAVAADGRAGKIKPVDEANIAAAIVAARKPTTDKLIADILAGDPWANLDAVAAEMARTIRGAK